MVPAIEKAYRAENLLGSYFTAPLRSYNHWFQQKIEASNPAYKTLWKVCYVATAIFAYPILGTIALVGIAINLCLIPPQNGYSLWARLNGVPAATEKFYAKLQNRLDLVFRGLFVGFTMMDSSSSSTRPYTYELNKKLSFDIQDVLQRPAGMEPCFLSIKNAIQRLSQKYTWAPEAQLIKDINGRTMVIIPLPDHIPLLA